MHPSSSHSIRRSNCSAASNSAFMAIAHLSSSDFWWKEMRAHEWEGKSSHVGQSSLPTPSGIAFPQEPELSGPAHPLLVHSPVSQEPSSFVSLSQLGERFQGAFYLEPSASQVPLGFRLTLNTRQVKLQASLQVPQSPKRTGGQGWRLGHIRGSAADWMSA